MSAPTCGELSCDECSARTAELTAERDQLRVDLELADVMYQRECEVEHELRTEVERLRSDRDCEKRLRKDAEEFREDAIARADSAEAECLEQARLLGKGAEREADLLGKVQRLEKDNAILKKKYNILFQCLTDANVEMHKAILDALEVDAYPKNVS